MKCRVSYCEALSLLLWGSEMWRGTLLSLMGGLYSVLSPESAHDVFFLPSTSELETDHTHTCPQNTGSWAKIVVG